jgi:hypothetical protein
LRRGEDESVPIILGTIRLMDIRSRLIGASLLNEPVIDKELHLYAPARTVVVNGPSGNRLRVGAIQPTAQRGIRRCQKQSGRNRGDQ